LLLIPLSASLLTAQYQDLTTDGHGVKVAFSSKLSLRSSARNDQPKLLQMDTAGLLTVLREETPNVLYPGDRYPVNFPSITRPEFSSDGSRLAFTGERWCMGGSGCVSVELKRGSVLWLDGSREAPSGGMARISANGDWAVYFNQTSLVSPYRFYRVNFATGWSELSSAGLSGAAGTGRRIIASDGTVLSAAGGHALTVRKPGQPDVQISLPYSTSYVTISNNAQLAIAQSSDSVPSVWLTDLNTHFSMLLLWAHEGVTRPALSDDGSTLIFLSGANYAATNNTLATQVWSMDMVTCELRQWTFEPAGIAEATVSGDGLVVWAVTKDGRLIKVDGLSGETQTFLGTSPVAESPDGTAWSPGSRYLLKGSGLNGVQVRWQGVDAQVVSATDTAVEFLMPWEVALGSGVLEIESSGSPFQPYQINGEVRRVAPLFIKTDGYIHGLRADGSPLTLVNPAKPGETVTLLMRGLGPLNAAGQTLETVVVTDNAASIDVIDSQADLGTPGTYRLTVRIPVDATGPLTLFVRAVDQESAADMGMIPI
jgi:uncharacterized protein (TIGR03437 family)